MPDAARGFGPRLQAATAYFSGVGRLGKWAIRQLFADLHGIPRPEVREGRQSREWFTREILPWLLEEVRHLLDQGSRCGRLKTAVVCGELRSIEASLWTFASREGVDPTNNAAERAVRHAVCWRKTIYGTDSERGSRFVERMLSVVASCRSQGRDVMDLLIQAITAGPDQSARPSILQTGP